MFRKAPPDYNCRHAQASYRSTALHTCGIRSVECGIARIYKEDQAEREHQFTITPDQREIATRDTVRRHRVRELLDSGALHTSEDSEPRSCSSTAQPLTIFSWLMCSA